MTAVSDTGYHFVEWSDDSTDNPRTDTGVTGNITVEASFAINTYTLTYTAGAHGSITGNSSQTVDYGGNGTAVTAVPGTGYHFVEWSDDSTDNPRTDTGVTGNITVEASFAINTYTLTYTAGAHGSISGNSSQTVDYGGNGSAVTAVPGTGYHFVKWSDDSTDNPRTDTGVTANISVDRQLRHQHLHPDLYRWCPRLHLGHQPPDGQLWRQRYGGDGGSWHRLPLRQVERRRHGQLPHRYQCDSQYLRDRQLRYQHLHPDLYRRCQRRHPAPAPDGQLWRQRYGGDRGSGHWISLRQLERQLDGRPPHGHQRDGQSDVTANFAINTYTLTYTAGANGSITGTQPADGQLWRQRHSGDGGAGYRLPLRQLERRRATAIPHRHQCDGQLSVTASFAINTYTLTYTAGANGSSPAPARRRSTTAAAARR